MKSTTNFRGESPLWVISRHVRRTSRCPLSAKSRHCKPKGQKRTSGISFNHLSGASGNIATFHPLAFSSLRFGLGAALYALVVWWREGSLRIAQARLRRHPPAGRGRHLRQPGRRHLRGAEGGRRQRRHAHGDRADHRRAARPPARARAHRRASSRRHRGRRHRCAARALRRWQRRRCAADRLAARARDGCDLGELLGARASDDGALQRRAARRPRCCSWAPPC